MSRKRHPTKRAPADREIDFHGSTAAEMRAALDLRWARREWHGLRSIRVIHGTGEVLWRELHRWCREKGIEFTLEAHQGATLLHPGQRLLADPPPSHRPLTPLKQRIQATAPETDGDQEKNGKDQSHQTPPPVPNARTPEHLNTRTPEHPTTESADLMAEEFASLAEEDPRAMQRRKHSLELPAPDRPAPPNPPPAAPTSESAPAPKAASDDLFAREFERLGREDPRILRWRKGSS